MMELREAIRKRRTVRRFKTKKVPRKDVMKLIEVSMMAPSSCNQQRYAYLIVDDARTKEKLKSEAGFKFATRIPVIIYVLCGKRYGRDKLAHVQGVSAGVMNMLLMAQELSLSTWWMATCGTHKEVMKLLRIPDDYIVLSAVGVGYGDEKPNVPQHRKIDDISHWNRFSSKLKEASVDPEEWPMSALMEFTSLAVFAKSSEIGYNHAFGHEFEKQMSVISGKLGRQVLMMHDATGIYTFGLASRRKDCSFTVWTYTGELKAWLDARAEHLGLNNIKILVKPELGTGSFDTVCILELINRIPFKETERLLMHTRRLVRKDGNLIVSSLNRSSVYGIAIRNGISRRFGPEKSLPRRRVMSAIKSGGFSIENEYGFNLIPSFKVFLHIDVPAHLTAFRSLLRSMAKMRRPESYFTRGPMKRLCTTSVFFCSTL